MKVFSTVDGPSKANNNKYQCMHFNKNVYVPKGYHKGWLLSASILADATAFRIARGTDTDIVSAGSAVAKIFFKWH